MRTHVTDPADAALLAVLLRGKPPVVRLAVLTEEAAITEDGRVDWAYAVVRARRLGADYAEILLLNIASNLSAPDVHDYRVVGGFCHQSLFTDLRQLGLLDLHQEMVAAWLDATGEQQRANELARV